MSRLPLPEDKHADFVQTLELERALRADVAAGKGLDNADAVILLRWLDRAEDHIIGLQELVERIVSRGQS